MLGWEFPPFFAGGVGIVAEALTRALARQDVEVTYVMPRGRSDASVSHLKLLIAAPGTTRRKFIAVPSFLGPYDTAVSYRRDYGHAMRVREHGQRHLPLYGADLMSEVDRFSEDVVALVDELALDFDLIHAHDWTTFPAALAIKRVFGKPAIVHVHITEFDKSGSEHADPAVYAVERAGMHGADRVVCVSHFTAKKCVDRYGVPASKIAVIHNGVESTATLPSTASPGPAGPLVLFLGRITLQKGPDYFLEAARRVLDFRPDVTFVMAGVGDMWPTMIDRSAAMGINHRIAFTGFVSREQARALYDIASVFVMPSVSEPFGIVPLEAMDRGVPTIVSRQSGVSEVVKHVFKVDFWDVDATASRILAALSYAPLARELQEQGLREVRRLSWRGAATKTRRLYKELLQG